MAKQDLKSVTLKDVFEISFGKEQGDVILGEIQAAYNQGLTGMPLRHKAEEIISKRVSRGDVEKGPVTTASAGAGAVAAGAAAASVIA